MSKIKPKITRDLVKAGAVTIRGDGITEKVDTIGEIHLVLKNKYGEVKEDRLSKSK